MLSDLDFLHLCQSHIFIEREKGRFWYKPFANLTKRTVLFSSP